MLGVEQILERFGFHKATIEGQNATAPKHADLRAQFIQFAGMLDALIPDGRYKEYLFYALENASMWAHKGIAQSAPLDPAEANQIMSRFEKYVRGPLKVCENYEPEVNCEGSIRQWFVEPDGEHPRWLCDLHVGMMTVRAIAPDVVTPKTRVDFTVEGRPTTNGL